MSVADQNFDEIILGYGKSMAEINLFTNKNPHQTELPFIKYKVCRFNRRIKTIQFLIGNHQAREIAAEHTEVAAAELKKERRGNF